MQWLMGKVAGYAFVLFKLYVSKLWPLLVVLPSLSLVPCLLQVYGVLDVQRVAGNFHISVHGLNIFVAQMVSSCIFLCVDVHVCVLLYLTIYFLHVMAFLV